MTNHTHIATKAVIWLLVAIATMSTIGCRSQKGNYKGDITTEASWAETGELFTQLAESYSGWSDLYVPVTLSLVSPKNMSISGRATMIYGQAINISLRFLGMEVGYVYIDTEDIYIVDKYHKYYFNEKIANLLGDTDITIADIQDLLLGRAVIPGSGIIKSTDSEGFTFLSADEQWLLTPLRQYKGAEWHYTATKTTPPLLSTVSVRLNGTVMQCKFSEPTSTPCGIADGISTLTIPYKKSDIVVSLIWNLGDANWNSDRKINFNAPSGYKRLDMEALIKGMDNF